MQSRKLTRIVVGCAGAGLLVASSARATDANKGHDLFETPPGGGILNFADAPIPADFFGPGSGPINNGTVDLVGKPLGTFMGFNVGSTDTIVKRLDSAMIPDGTGESDTISTEIVALSLKSINPITVTFNGGQNPEDWDLLVTLSAAAQTPGSMTITHSGTSGGTFDATLHVIPLLTFTKVDPPNQGQMESFDADGVYEADMSTTKSTEWEHIPTHGQLVVFGLTGDEGNMGPLVGTTDFYVFGEDVFGGEVRHTGPHPRAIPTPPLPPPPPAIPTVSEWAMIVMALLLFTVATVVIRGRRMGVGRQTGAAG